MTRKRLPPKLPNPILVGAIDYTTWAEQEVPYVFFCVPCWRRYLTGSLTRAALEQCFYFAYDCGRGKYRCSQCARVTDRYPTPQPFPKVP